MSSNIEFNEKDFILWKASILTLLDSLYSNGNTHLLALILQQLYEIAVWYCHDRHDHRLPIVLKDLERYRTDDASWALFAGQLYLVRNSVTHAPYEIFKDSSGIVDVLSNPNFRILLSMLYTEEEATKFDLMLCSYSRWLYTD